MVDNSPTIIGFVDPDEAESYSCGNFFMFVICGQFEFHRTSKKKGAFA